MTEQQLERAAYRAAHRIAQADMRPAGKYACPGRQHVWRVDKMAEIIAQEIVYTFAAPQPAAAPAIQIVQTMRHKERGK